AAQLSGGVRIQQYVFLGCLDPISSFPVFGDATGSPDKLGHNFALIKLAQPPVNPPQIKL
ncbi:MAG TPA: hypothetical protein VLS96_11510, partial [Nodosilinea sp.]|nr:hypothetical protein [Nodosilinea sp.]